MIKHQIWAFGLRGLQRAPANVLLLHRDFSLRGPSILITQDLIWGAEGDGAPRHIKCSYFFQGGSEVSVSRSGIQGVAGRVPVKL